jgi:aspartate kinase
VRIKNTMNPGAAGTLITRKGAKSEHLCKSIAAKKGVTAITLTTTKMLMAVGFLADVFGVFKKHRLAVDLVSTGEISVTVTVNLAADAIPHGVIEDLTVFSQVEILGEQAIICAVGNELAHKKGVAAKIFAAIADAGISVKAISQSAMEINISCLIAEAEAENALKALHKAIFEEGSPLS